MRDIQHGTATISYDSGTACTTAFSSSPSSCIFFASRSYLTVECTVVEPKLGPGSLGRRNAVEKVEVTEGIERDWWVPVRQRVGTIY